MSKFVGFFYGFGVWLNLLQIFSWVRVYVVYFTGASVPLFFVVKRHNGLARKFRAPGLGCEVIFILWVICSTSQEAGERDINFLVLTKIPTV